MELKNKWIIVTGDSRGIGLELAKKLLENGARVAGWSRHDPGIDHPGFRHYHVDVSKGEDIDKAWESGQKDFGAAVAALVNNAGYGFFKYLEDYTAEEWQDMYAVNVFGLFYASKKVLPQMKRQRSGHIVNISSIAGKEGIAQASAYCGSKFAVRGISAALYKEVKEFNIKVTCVMPGSVNTHFFDRTEATTANPTMLHPADLAQTIVQLLETPDNYNPSEIEIRPMNVRYQ